ncbi:hypothetical protein CYMTET_44835 [Cymbomonas tetramitiformis]|uniref:Uncharacterized protein n=1 Tax=Cymbomonas tetramitiformis TaxID=36881 RepID=A0AAE0C0L7_9CHLO|nr:hypothetical protein CYMTET_44835 [Cymbomonas tetramitiformis]
MVQRALLQNAPKKAQQQQDQQQVENMVPLAVLPSVCQGKLPAGGEDNGLPELGQYTRGVPGFTSDKVVNWKDHWKIAHQGGHSPLIRSVAAAAQADAVLISFLMKKTCLQLGQCTMGAPGFTVEQGGEAEHIAG